MHFCARVRCLESKKKWIWQTFLYLFCWQIFQFYFCWWFFVFSRRNANGIAQQSDRHQTERREKWERERIVQFPNYEWFIVLFPFDQIKIITNAKTKVMQSQQCDWSVGRPTGRGRRSGGCSIDAGHGAYRFGSSFLRVPSEFHCKYRWASITINRWLNWRRNAGSVKCSFVVSLKCENFNSTFSVAAIRAVHHRGQMKMQQKCRAHTKRNDFDFVLFLCGRIYSLVVFESFIAHNKWMGRRERLKTKT